MFLIIQNYNIMSKDPIVSKLIVPERKIWSPEEDDILKQILTSNKSQKWSEIAKIMETQYNIVGRTGKQCRERWHNQLDPNIKNETWSEQEENKLFQYHNKFGNKWAKIAQMLPGRTDNCIKNHFYCTLRKSLRRINKFINLPKNKGKLKQIKNIILSKVIAVAQQKFQRKLQVPEELIENCCEIKNRLIKYSKDIDTQQEQQQEELVSLINNIMEFNNAYKRKKNRKKPAKTQTNKSSKQDDSNSELDDEEDDKVDFMPDKNLVQQSKSSPPLRQPSVPQPQPQKQIINPAIFTKKPSLRAYLLTPSMQMQLQDRLRPDVNGLFPNFEPSSPPRMDGTNSPQLDSIFKGQFMSNQQKGFTPVLNNPNPVWGQLRKIESFDYQNYRKRN